MTTTINASTSSGLVNTADTSGILQLQTASTAALTITAAQNVGIGTASPAQKLHVSDTTTSTVKTRTEASTGYVDVGMGGNSGVFDTTATDGIRLRTSGNDRLAIDTSGNVGIGTSSPSYKLQVNSTATTDGVYITNSSSDGTYIYLNNSSTNGRQYRFISTGAGNGPGAGTLGVFDNTANAYRTVIDSSGNLLVNKTSQTNTGKLEIDYSRATSAGTNYNETSSSSTCTHIAFQRGGSGVGSISSPNNSSTAYNTSSDYRLKENIAPMTGALAKVALLKPVTYKWKVDGSDGEGFIAHELAEVKPDCVSGDKDATRQEEYEVTPAVKDEEGNITTPAVMGTRTAPVYQGIDTSFLVATLTAAIQELSAKNDALTARITALENA